MNRKFGTSKKKSVCNLRKIMHAFSLEMGDAFVWNIVYKHKQWGISNELGVTQDVKGMVSRLHVSDRSYHAAEKSGTYLSWPIEPHKVHSSLPYSGASLNSKLMFLNRDLPQERSSTLRWGMLSSAYLGITISLFMCAFRGILKVPQNITWQTGSE